MTEEFPDVNAVGGSDVLRAILSIAGLTIGLGVTLLFAYGVMVVFGYEGASVMSLPIVLALETVAILGGIYFALVRTGRLTWRDLGWIPVSPGWMVAGGLTSLAIYAAAIALVTLARTVLGDAWFGVTPPLVDVFPRSVLGFLGSFVFGAITVPIAEEFLFRGLLFRWLRNRWGFSAGAFVSALVFALVHPQASGSAPLIFLIGLALAYFYERSGSLWPSMVLHGVNNAVGIAFIYLTIWAGQT